MTSRSGGVRSNEMTVRETIHVEVDAVPDQQLGDLLEIVRDFAHQNNTAAEDLAESIVKPTIFDKLMKIRIQGPPDFSENVELYASGEKQFED